MYTIAAQSASTVAAAPVVVMPQQPEPVQVHSVVSSIVDVQVSSSSTTADEGEDEDDFKPVLQVENNIGEPEYDFLSRQPSEFAEETYRIHNIKPTQAAKQKPRGHATAQPSPVPGAAAAPPPAAVGPPRNNGNAGAAPAAKHDSLHPTGLVTKLGGTVVKDGTTTVHETSVIGTYISGKYAQVLQSTSHVFNNPAAAPGAGAKGKIAPTPSLRILKTAAPHIPKAHAKQQQQQHGATVAPTAPGADSLPIDEVYGNSPSTNLVRASRRPATASGSFKNRFRQRTKEDAGDYGETAPSAAVQPTVEIQATPAYQSGKKTRVHKNQKG